MSMQAAELQPIDQDELVSFLIKLADFHSTLSPREQTILDDMTAKAMTPPAQEAEVQGFALSMPGAAQTALGQAFNSPALIARSYYRPANVYYYAR
jgi:hypothetical protein